MGGHFRTIYERFGAPRVSLLPIGACAAAPDDVETGRAADDALRNLEQLLAAAERAAQTA